jgi:hypothetical protein
MGLSVFAGKEFIGDHIIATVKCMAGELAVPRTEAGGCNVGTSWCFLGEEFKIAIAFKDSTIAKNNAIAEHVLVSIVVLKGFGGGEKGSHFINMHDDVWVLIGVVAKTNVRWEGVVVENGCGWGSAERNSGCRGWCRCWRWRRGEKWDGSNEIKIQSIEVVGKVECIAVDEKSKFVGA